MKKYTYILWITIFTVVLGACSKDKNVCDPNDEESLCYAGPSGDSKLLLKEYKKNGKTELRFEYDDQDRVVIIHINTVDGSMNSNYFVYDGQSRLISVDRKDGSKVYLREEYTYGSGNKPISGVWKNVKNEITSNIKFTYSGNSTVETHFDEKGELINTFNYTFDNRGNPLRIEIGQSIQEFDDYDDKHYSFTNYPWAWKLSSINNAQSYKITAPIGSVDQIWKYSYNTAGYPIKTEIYNRGSNVVVETLTYSYVKSLLP